MKSIYWKLSSNWERGDHISGGWGMFVDWKIKEIGKIELAPSSGLFSNLLCKRKCQEILSSTIVSWKILPNVNLLQAQTSWVIFQIPSIAIWFGLNSATPHSRTSESLSKEGVCGREDFSSLEEFWHWLPAALQSLGSTTSPMNVRWSGSMNIGSILMTWQDWIIPAASVWYLVVNSSGTTR